MEAKQSISKKLIEYNKRRERYREILKSCSRNIKSLNEKYQINVKLQEEIKVPIKQVEEFFGKNLKNKGRNKQFNREISFLCKHVLESGIKHRGLSEKLAKYIGYRRKKTVYDKRRELTKSFIPDVNTKIVWNSLKRFSSESIKTVVLNEKEGKNSLPI